MSRSHLSITTHTVRGEGVIRDMTATPIGTQAFDLNAGESATITVGPGAGYRIYAVPRAEREDVTPA